MAAKHHLLHPILSQNLKLKRLIRSVKNPWKMQSSVLHAPSIGEAKGEGVTGMEAVANVVMNRFYKPPGEKAK
jgi:hypothetical protein